jgi:hypothetical protein
MKYGFRRQMAIHLVKHMVNLCGALGFTPYIYLDEEEKKPKLDLFDLKRWDASRIELHRLNVESVLKSIEKGEE